MEAKAFALTIAVLLASTALAQSSGGAAEGERAPRPEAASNARVGGWCDALTGTKKEECLRDGRREQERAAAGRTTRGTCDTLIGPEKERCRHEGGTVEVDATSGAGAAADRGARAD
jgi:hypothetical protein